MRTFEDDDPLFAPMLNALFAAFRGTAVMSGCAPSATGANRNVTVAAGSVQIGGATVAVAGGTVTLDAGGEFDRYDLVTCDTSGTLTVTKGTVERKCPTQPADTCLIAIVFVPAGATVIATGNVYDARMLTSTVACGQIISTRIRPESSDEVRWGPKTGVSSITIPQIYVQGTAKISMRISPYFDGEYQYPGDGSISINGTVVASQGGVGSGGVDLVGVYSIKGGDVIAFSGRTITDLTIALSDTPPVVYPAAPTWPV